MSISKIQVAQMQTNEMRFQHKQNNNEFDNGFPSPKLITRTQRERKHRTIFFCAVVLQIKGLNRISNYFLWKHRTGDQQDQAFIWETSLSVRLATQQMKNGGREKSLFRGHPLKSFTDQELTHVVWFVIQSTRGNRIFVRKRT